MLEHNKIANIEIKHSSRYYHVIKIKSTFFDK